MAQGDAQRQWFTEMKMLLVEQFVSEPSWEDLILLAERLDTMLQQIRFDRNILPAMFFCKKCGKQVRSKAGRISVNAVILAAGRFGAAAETDMKKLSRSWKKHQKEHALDLYGREIAVADNEAPGLTCHLSSKSKDGA